MSKENRPILPFYANDFLGSTAAMEPAEVGMYIRLLSYQWINGPFPSNFKAVCRLAGIESSDVDASAMLRALLEHKFSIDLAGNYSNKRLEVERAGSFEKDAERKARAKRAADIRWENERLRKAEAEFEKNNSDNSNFEDATSNAQAYAKDHAKSMPTESETESIVYSEEYSNTYGTLSGNGEKNLGGSKNLQLSQQKFDLCAFARAFVTAYGKQGKIAAVERQMATAWQQIKARAAPKQEIRDDEIAAGILNAAQWSLKHDQKAQTEQKYRLNPETWLEQRQYEIDWQSATEQMQMTRKQELETQDSRMSKMKLDGL